MMLASNTVSKDAYIMTVAKGQPTSTKQPQPTLTEQTQPTSTKQTQPTSTKQTRPTSASVNLYGEKTQVNVGEEIRLKLSAVNLITKPLMHVQVIIIPPSGMSVSSSEFVESGAGQYTATDDLCETLGREKILK